MKQSQEKFLDPVYTNYVKEEIKARTKNWIQPARVSGFICPCCSSGDGPHGTGIIESRKHPNSFCCYSSRTGECWDGYQDIIGIIRHMNKDLSFYDALELAAEKVGYEFPDPELFKDPEHLPPHTNPVIVRDSMSSGFADRPKQELIEIIQKDIEKYQQYLDQTDYFEKRGLSKATVERFGCGYAPEWEHPGYAALDIEKEKERLVKILQEEGYSKAWENICAKTSDPYLYIRKHHPFYLYRHNLHLSKPKPSKRFIVPISESAYLVRDISSAQSDYQRRYAKMKVGKQFEGFNWSSLKEPHPYPIIVTEGEFDAMSVEEVGYHAIALGSVSMVNRFCAYIKENSIKFDYPLIISLDSDAVGRKTSAKMFQDLREARVPNIQFSITLPGTKDPNESLVTDRKAFTQKVEKAVSRTKELHVGFLCS